MRGEIVEDMALARLVKRQRLRLVAALGAPVLAVRMYDSPRAMLRGFAKNVYPLLGGAPLPALAAVAALLLVGLGPFAAAAAGAWWPLLLLAAVRLAHAAMTRGRPLDVLLHPAGVALAVAVTGRSMAAHHRGRVSWKSRSITMERA